MRLWKAEAEVMDDEGKGWPWDLGLWPVGSVVETEGRSGGGHGGRRRHSSR